MRAEISIHNVFKRASEKKEKVLIVYLTGGFPDLESCFEIILEIEQGGADIIELGIPFSDPVADGPTIQYSSQIALEQGATLSRILDRLENTLCKVPVIIMTYLNPLLRVGRSKLFKRLVQSGISGVVIPDLPFEMAGDWETEARRRHIDLIMLAAPTSPRERLQEIVARSQGFIYCVSATGTTGIRDRLPGNLRVFLQHVRSMTDKSLTVGFGISRPDQILELKEYADGFIVGSRMINAIRNNEHISDVVAEFKAATRR